MPFFAHPKVEPNSTLWNFGVSNVAGLLTMHCVGVDGALERVESIKITSMAMVHDFAVAQCHLAFLLPSFVYDVDCSYAGVPSPDSHV